MLPCCLSSVIVARAHKASAMAQITQESLVKMLMSMENEEGRVTKVRRALGRHNTPSAPCVTKMLFFRAAYVKQCQCVRSARAGDVAGRLPDPIHEAPPRHQAGRVRRALDENR